MESTKEMFLALLKSKGYPSLNSFCLAFSLDYGNMNRRVNGVKRKVEISFMFKLADMLNEPVETIISIFYPIEWAENRKHVKKRK